MRRKSQIAFKLVVLLTVVLDCQFCSAAKVVIQQTTRGYITESGHRNPTILNYGVGDLRSSACDLVLAGCVSDARNFFVFDLSSVTEPIASAELVLQVPSQFPGPSQGYTSPDPSENFELHDVVTPLATLVNGTGGVAAHADLGSGTIYGSRTMTAADNGHIVVITLNANAIAALNAATGLIGLGGSLTTLDAAANEEYTFGFTSFLSISDLRLTLVPEPSTSVLCLVGVATALMRRKQPPL